MGPPDPLAALIAEAQTGTDPAAVPLAHGTLVQVRPTWQWPWRAVEYVRAGRYQRWAADCLAGDGPRLWGLADLTNRQVRDFLTDWGRRGGDDIHAIHRMAPIIANHTRTLEGDLATTRVDLRDLWRPGGGTSALTWRRLGVLWDALPGQCLTKTAMRDAIGDERLAELAGEPPTAHGPWTHEALLLAGIFDAVRVLTWRFEQVNFSDGSKIPQPDPLRRPGVVARKAKRISAEGLAYLQYLRQHRGAAPPGTKNLGSSRG